MKSITKAVIMLTIFSVISKLLGFVFRIYLSYSIGEKGVAIYQIAISLFFVLLTLVASGIPSIISRQIAIYTAKKQNAKTHSLITSSLVLVTILCFVITVTTLLAKKIFLLLKVEEQAINLLYLMLPAFIFSAYQNVFRGYMWGKSDFFKMSMIELIEQISRITLCMLLATQVFKVDCLQATAISLNISCFISMALSIIYYVLNKGKLKFAGRETLYLAKASTPITAVRMVGSLVQPVTAIVVPLMLVKAGYQHSNALSLYGAATGMVLPMLFLPSTFIGALAQALIPDLSSKMATKNNDAVLKQVRSSIIFTTIVSLVLVPIFSGLGYEIGKFLFNSEMAGQLLEMSAWIMLPLGLSNLSTSMLNAIGLEVKGFVNYIFGTVALLLCIFALPKYIGISAIIIGMGLCMTVTTVLNIAMLSKQLQIKFNILKTVMLLCIFIIPIYLIIVNCFGVFKHIFPTFINLGVCSGIGVVCYLILCIAFNIIKISTLKTELLRKTHKKVKLT